jgi:hypothetical protein
LHASVGISGMDRRRPDLLQFAAFLGVSTAKGLRLAHGNRRQDYHSDAQQQFNRVFDNSVDVRARRLPVAFVA